MCQINWQEILEAFFQDTTVRGVSADKALASALIRSGMRDDATVVAFMRALLCMTLPPTSTPRRQKVSTK